MWESDLGQAGGHLCRRVAGTRSRTRERSVQEQETVPRESCPEDNEKSMHLRWGPGGQPGTG